MRKIGLVFILLFFIGCVNKKEITLESLSLIDANKLNNKYINNKYIKKFGRDKCILSLKDSELYKDGYQFSNELLEFTFTSNNKLGLDRADINAIYINTMSNNKDLPFVGLCPLINKNRDGYKYTFFYPTEYVLNDTTPYKLKESNDFIFSIKHTDYMGWETNKIGIDKSMIKALWLSQTQQIVKP